MKKNKYWLVLLCLAFLSPPVVLAIESNQEEVINGVELEVELDGDLWIEKDVSNYYLLDEENRRNSFKSVI